MQRRPPQKPKHAPSISGEGSKQSVLQLFSNRHECLGLARLCLRWYVWITLGNCQFLLSLSQSEFLTVKHPNIGYSHFQALEPCCAIKFMKKCVKSLIESNWVKVYVMTSHHQPNIIYLYATHGRLRLTIIIHYYRGLVSTAYGKIYQVSKLKPKPI